MENISQFKWRQIYIAYGLIGFSIISLLFSGLYDAGFVKWLTGIGLGDAVPGINITKIVMAVLDVSMMAVLIIPLENEDERVDKIRNFAVKTTFRMAVGFIIMLGFYSVKIDFLLFAAIIQAYYFLLFYLSLYRDAGMVYMNNEELKIYDKMVSKRFRIYFIIQMGLMGASTSAVISTFHRPELVGIVVAVNTAILVLVKTVYMSWKS